jgi:hypothetical protein
VGASVFFAFFWIALIPVFGAPKLDTGGESFRCDLAQTSRCLCCAASPQQVELTPARQTPRYSASSGEVAENLFMFKAALRASVSTGLEPTCEDVTFDAFPDITGDVLAQLVAVGGGDCAGLKGMLEAAGMNCDTDLIAALAGLPAAIQAAAASGDAALLSTEQISALVSFQFPDDINHLYQVCPATCGECGDGGSTSGEAGEHALQSKP